MVQDLGSLKRLGPNPDIVADCCERSGILIINNRLVIQSSADKTTNTPIPSVVQESYFNALVTYWPQYFDDALVKENGYLLTSTSLERTLEYFILDDTPLRLRVTLSNICFNHPHKADQPIDNLGSTCFVLEKTDDDTLKIIAIYASSLALEALKLRDKKIDLDSQAFRKLLNFDDPVIKSADKLKKAIFARRIAGINEGESKGSVNLSVDEAEKILMMTMSAYSESPNNNTTIFTRLLDLTCQFIDDSPAPSRKEFADVFSQVHQLDRQWSGPLTGSLLILLGASFFVAAALSTGPAGIGLLGIDLALKLLKIYTFQHLTLASASVASMASGLPFLFFGQTSAPVHKLNEDLCDIEKRFPESTAK